jgi:hypothetical protein
MFASFLRLMALACVIPVILHGFFGVSGDWIIGAPVAHPIDASLDSQNRFYGVAFGIYAALLWVSARDIRRHAGLLKILFAGMFVAGCARIPALILYGLPSPHILFLMATEILFPPILLFGLKRHLATTEN